MSERQVAAWPRGMSLPVAAEYCGVGTATLNREGPKPVPGLVALPVLLGLYTAQRRADVIKLPWSAYDGRTITLRQSKAREKARILVIPVHPVLRVALDAAPRTAVTICARADGHSWKIDHFAKAFAAARTKLGLPDDMQFHGLRHSAASRMAEAGATDAQVQAITGHETRQMVEFYTAGAKQKKLAKAAIAKLPKRQIKNSSRTGSEKPVFEK